MTEMTILVIIILLSHHFLRITIDRPAFLSTAAFREQT